MYMARLFAQAIALAGGTATIFVVLKEDETSSVKTKLRIATKGRRSLVLPDPKTVEVKVPEEPSANVPLEVSKETMDSVDFSLCTNAMVPRDLFIPIFIMTRDRISSFQQTLESYQRTFTSPFEIIILDHDSTYPPMVQYLHELKMNQSITVVPLKEKNWGMKGGGALKEANSIIQDYLDQHPRVQFYVFTDPDIAFLRTAPDVLLFYAGLLQSCPKFNTVGPGLQISDIPSRFTKKVSNGKQVFEQHSRFWTDVPNIATWNGVGYHVAKHPIDTTFAMYRRNVPFKRLQGPSLRAYAPYAAVHVDWYDDSENLPADKVFYTKRQMGANNW